MLFKLLSKKNVNRYACLGVFLYVINSLNVSAMAEDWLYSVKKGDTLWGLCEKYTTKNTCWLEIGDYNGVAYPRVMAPGTRIKFPIAWLKAAPIPVTLTFVRGDVSVVSDSGDQLSAHVGQDVFMGDSVVTGEDSSATLLFADGSVSVVGGQSTVTMDLLSIDNNTAIVDSRILLKRGTVSTKVPKYNPDQSDSSNGNKRDSIGGPRIGDAGDAASNISEQKHYLQKRKPRQRSYFQVTTPSAVAAVRGTDFTVSAGETGELMRGEVYSGGIAVSKHDLSDRSLSNDRKKKEQALAAGFGLVVQQGKAIPKPVALLEAPEFEQLVDQQTLPLSLYWKEVPQASYYAVNVFSGEHKNQLIHNEQIDTPNWESSDLVEGCYTFAVRAIDANDLRGHASTANACVVYQPIAPQAAYDATQGQLVWERVDYAESYRVEFSNSRTFKKVMATSSVKSTTEQRYSFDLTTEAVASYKYVRIVAVSSSDVTGDASTIIALDKSNKNWVTGVISFVIFLTAFL